MNSLTPIFKIKSIVRYLDEDQTRIDFLDREIILTARPIRVWKNAYWGMWPAPGIRWQCPWLTFVMIKKKMNNQEKFLNAEMLWDGNRYHYSLDDAICHFHEVDGLEPDDCPISLELCEKHYGLAQTAADVAECIRDEPLANASGVEEEFLEVLYFDCDDWADEYISMGCLGVEELDWAISIFKSLNHWVYLLFGSSPRFKPGRDVIGLWFLDRALQRFERAQRDRHSVWYPSKPKIEWDLTWEFVQEYLKEVEK